MEDAQTTEMQNSNDPVATGGDQGRRVSKRYFHEHLPSLVDAGKRIKRLNDQLRSENNVDRRNAMHDRMDSEIAQLHLAINNAVRSPEAPKENTGGTNEGPIDQDEFKD